MSYNKLASELIYSGQALRIPTKPQPSAVRTLCSILSLHLLLNIPDLMKAYPARSCGPSSDKVVALTFDDGPDPVFTPDFRRTSLSRRASHFLCAGRSVAQYPQVQRMIQEGHVVGGHSWSHPNLRSLSADRIRWQVENTAKEIKVDRPRAQADAPPYGRCQRRNGELAHGQLPD